MLTFFCVFFTTTTTTIFITKKLTIFISFHFEIIVQNNIEFNN